jgi:hypothetical protein
VGPSGWGQESGVRWVGPSGCERVSGAKRVWSNGSGQVGVSLWVGPSGSERVCMARGTPGTRWEIPRQPCTAKVWTAWPPHNNAGQGKSWAGQWQTRSVKICAIEDRAIKCGRGLAWHRWPAVAMVGEGLHGQRWTGFDCSRAPKGWVASQRWTGFDWSRVPKGWVASQRWTGFDWSRAPKGWVAVCIVMKSWADVLTW